MFSPLNIVVLMGYAVRVVEKHEDLENQGVEVRIILKRILKKQDRGAHTWLLWLRTGTSGGLLLTRLETSKMRRFFGPTEKLLASI